MNPLDLNRRDFLSLAGAGALASYLSPAIAGPFTRTGDEFPIPADKKFTKEWLASLRARGEPLTATLARDELRHIGMPVGGVGCGQVYLSGDGRLWHWDVMNLPPSAGWSESSGVLYANPAAVTSPFKFEGALERAGSTRPLDARGFRDITFIGQYPVGTVRYGDPDEPVRVELRAFSPFCPLDVEDSSLPCTVLTYRFTNPGPAPVECSLRAVLENPIASATATRGQVRRLNTAIPAADGTPLTLVCRAEPVPPDPARPRREDIVFEGFESGTYDGWTATGTAFGASPRKLDDIAGYQGDLRAVGSGVVNTHESRQGEDVRAADAHIGTLTSREFTIERTFVSFRVGGGRHPGQTCVNLLVDGAPVRTATGTNDNAMRLENWNVGEFMGRPARIQIVDGWRGEWGNIGVDDIVFTDEERAEPYDAPRAPDFGTLALALAGAHDSAAVNPEFAPGDRPVGELRVPIRIPPGQSREVSLVIAWHFPNVNRQSLAFLAGIESLRRHYAARFRDAGDAAAFVAANLDRLSATTVLWRDTWYDSTLPCWFLDRAFANVSTAATGTCLRFDTGRFYGWEGTHCCAGTCTHVWQYAQGLARVFPSLERSLRREIDFATEFDERTGLIHYRGEAARSLAIDGQCGTIVRAWREHTMSPDDSFLRAVYPNVKKALELVIARDPDADGLLDGEQYNTLDTSWYGKIAWISSLYVAALRAGSAMARDAGDADFQQRCAQLADAGMAALAAQLFNGEYFVHKTDPAKPETNSTGDGCHIDQVLGQSFAWQTGLARVTPKEQTVSALRSLYRYSFAPDIGPYRSFAERTIKGGRWYAMPGEGGLLMCTWPKGGSDAATGKSGDAWAAGYFNECMSGFEHQAASHMIAEGLVTEGLAVTRMIHDRYHPARRNPYNEVECSNHYARAMASYGSFVTACGFTHHGPHGRLGFEPRVFANENDRTFRAPFIACEGWGTYDQRVENAAAIHTLRVAYGRVRLTQLTLPLLTRPAGARGAVTVTMNDGAPVPIAGDTAAPADETVSGFGTRTLTFGKDPVVVRAGQTLTVRFS